MTRAAGSSRHGRACCGCWLVAALGAGVCLLGAAPRDGCCWLGRGACVLLRDVPVTAERGAAFLARSARSMSAALSRRSLCPAPGGASFRPRPRRGSSPTRPPGEGCVADPSLASTAPPSTSRGSPLTQRHAIKTPCDRRSKRPAAGAAANRADRTFHHRGLLPAPLRAACSLTP